MRSRPSCSTIIVEGRLIFMYGKILENVINQMSPHPGQEQLEHLNNLLHMNFQGKEASRFYSREIWKESDYDLKKSNKQY
jgi:hypothetical protein